MSEHIPQTAGWVGIVVGQERPRRRGREGQPDQDSRTARAGTGNRAAQRTTTEGYLMEDRIIIHRDRIAATRPLLAESALSGCTLITDHGDHLEVTLRWPSISTGERALWALLHDVTTGALNEVAWSCDLASRSAVARTLAMLLDPESVPA